MSKPGRKSMHSMRISDDLWDRFISCAQSRGRSGTDVVSEMMTAYIENAGSISSASEQMCDSKLLFAALKKFRQENVDATQAIDALLRLYLRGKITFEHVLEANLTE